MKVRLLRASLCCVIPLQLHLQLKLETEQLRTVLRTLSSSEVCDQWRRTEKTFWEADSPSNMQGRWYTRLDGGGKELLYPEEKELCGILLSGLWDNESSLEAAAWGIGDLEGNAWDCFWKWRDAYLSLERGVAKGKRAFYCPDPPLQCPPEAGQWPCLLGHFMSVRQWQYDFLKNWGIVDISHQFFQVYNIILCAYIVKLLSQWDLVTDYHT